MMQTISICGGYDGMDLRHLRYFVAVAEERHITRAAERLGIQQPPLSQQIQSLEAELEVKLFKRRPRGVELTEAGAALLIDARKILADVEQAVSTVRRTARGELGRISIGTTVTAPFHPFIPRVVRAFRESNPLVTVELTESRTPDLIDALRGDRMDLVFIRTPIADLSGVIVHPLLTEEMIVALPEGHRLTGGMTRSDPGLSLRELASEPFINYQPVAGPGLYEAVIAAFHASGFSPQTVQTAPRIFLTLNLVAAGLGVTIVPESLQRMNVEGVVYRRVKDSPALKVPLNLAHRRNEVAPAVCRFIELVKARAAKMRTAKRQTSSSA
jgi:DNA-binding transcriptional LysR family regulator